MTEPVCRRRDDALWRRTTDTTVVLPRHGDEPLVLSGAAALFWDLLEIATPLEDVVDLLARACDIDPAEARGHLEPLVVALSDAGVIEAGTT